jgi:hypothetical protein
MLMASALSRMASATTDPCARPRVVKPVAFVDTFIVVAVVGADRSCLTNTRATKARVAAI